MEVKPGYKQTEVGVIPEEWSIRPLGSICDVRDGTHESPRFYKDGVPFVTSKNIVDGRLDLENVSFISKSDAVEFDKRSKVDRNDILLSMIGTIGSAVLVNCEPDFCIKNVALIKPRKVAPTYLIRLINAPQFQKYLADNLNGGIQKFISLGKLRQLSIPLPEDAEQGAIATALSDVDGLLGGLDRLIAKKRDLKQAAMQQLLTGQTRLPTFDGAWVVRQFGSLIEHVFPKSTLSSGDGLEHGTYPLLVSGGEPKRTEVAQFRDNVALVFSDGGIFAVKCAKGSFSVTDHCYALKLNAALADMRWFEAWFSLNAQQLDQMTFKGSGLRNLDKPSLRKIEIRCPGLVEQTAIAEALNDMDAELEALEARRDKMSALKHGMMQELLTGRIRLVEGEALHA